MVPPDGEGDHLAISLLFGRPLENAGVVVDDAHLAPEALAEAGHHLGRHAHLTPARVRVRLRPGKPPLLLEVLALLGGQLRLGRERHQPVGAPEPEAREEALVVSTFGENCVKVGAPDGRVPPEVAAPHRAPQPLDRANSATLKIPLPGLCHFAEVGAVRLHCGVRTRVELLQQVVQVPLNFCDGQLCLPLGQADCQLLRHTVLALRTVVPPGLLVQALLVPHVVRGCGRRSQRPV